MPAVNPIPNDDEIIQESEMEIDPSPEQGGGLFSDFEFQRRVQVVMEAIEDPEKHRRAIAEIHTYLSLITEGFAQMQQEMANSGGPMGLLKMMFGKKG
jgi:hypothetical protein